MAFLTFSDLRGKWLGDIAEKTNRGGFFPRGDIRTRQAPRETPMPTKLNTPEPPTGGPGSGRIGQYIPGYLCRNYNFGKCKVPGEVCQATWDPSHKLLHQCGFFNKDTRKYCLQNHPIIEHK
jgi:hypothetical protein